ncbi:Glutathione S-transferase mu class [Paragonimus heterotremus]|uniref:glutathione transferase n=1 Tax=Paragonimus heterotremus TaxID=100268 RepID=A0A8J4WE06_9TREM|nr:Glutathione S-transferase mu class [Paragonimus heterotremus]
MSPVLGYWKLRGLAQPIRLLLEFVGDKYDEKLYDRNDREKWFKEKFTMGFGLPNLPYYQDGNLKLTQSLAILRYIADKHKMLGNTPEERATISMIEGALGDLRNGVSRIAYNEKFEELKVDYLKNLPATLRMWSEFLGDKPYLHHSTPSHLDFMFYEALDVLHYLEPTCLDAFPNLSQFMHRIEAIPNIKAYMESDRFIKWPLNGWLAFFGGGDAPPS